MSCFKATATPDIYTYLHPLSLHAALPICLVARKTQRLRHGLTKKRVAECGENQPERGLVHRPIFMAVSELVDEIVDRVEDGIQRVAVRSEEHTSALQSLMRISYAVFCLKKQKIQQRRENRYKEQ